MLGSCIDTMSLPILLITEYTVDYKSHLAVCTQEKNHLDHVWYPVFTLFLDFTANCLK